MQYKYQQHKKFKKDGRKNSFLQFTWLIDCTKKLLALTALAMAATIVYPWELHNDIMTFKDEIPSKMGFVVNDINIQGYEHLTPEDIAGLITFNPGDNLYAVPIDTIRTQLESHPWIASATVERVLPSTIHITIHEERPKAVFINGNERFFVNDDGKIIEKINDIPTGENYIYLIGKEANLSYSSILDEVYESEEIYQRIEGLVKIGQRRWDLKLKNNITVKLPQKGVMTSLSKFSEIMRDNIDFFKSGSIIDLRFMPEKIYIKY
jgi:cell division protein FtsQ